MRQRQLPRAIGGKLGCCGDGAGDEPLLIAQLNDHEAQSRVEFQGRIGQIDIVRGRRPRRTGGRGRARCIDPRRGRRLNRDRNDAVGQFFFRLPSPGPLAAGAR